MFKIIGKSFKAGPRSHSVGINPGTKVKVASVSYDSFYDINMVRTTEGLSIPVTHLVPYDDGLDLNFRAPLYGTSSYSKLQTMLEENGYEELGAGMNSIVYGKHDNSVIKVGRTARDGWVAYAEAVRKHFPNNPYAPRIPWIRFYGEGKDRFFMAKIERLKSIHTSNEAAREYESIDSEKANPQLRELMACIDELGKIYGPDLSASNCMVRDGNQLVITDPLHRKHSKKKVRFNG